MSDLWDNFTERLENDYVRVWIIVEKLHEWKKQNKPAYRQFYQLIGMFFSTCNLADKVTLFYVNESGHMMPFKQENNMDDCSTHNLITSLLKIDPFEDIDECSLDVFEIYETYLGCFWKLDELEQIEQFKNIKVFAQLFTDRNESTSLDNEAHSLNDKHLVPQVEKCLVKEELYTEASKALVKVKKSPRGKSKAKEKAQSTAKTLANDLWNQDNNHKIKIKEMAITVYGELYQTEHRAQLPDQPASLKKWIEDIAPEYAREAGRPKEI